MHFNAFHNIFSYPFIILQVMLVIVFNLILMGIEVNITLGRPAGAETPTIFLALNIGIAPQNVTFRASFFFTWL